MCRGVSVKGSQYIEYVGSRGVFMTYLDMGVVTVTLGPIDDAESEHTVTVHHSLIPELIANLRLAQDKYDRGSI